jgi:hypothetical protein
MSGKQETFSFLFLVMNALDSHSRSPKIGTGGLNSLYITALYNTDQQWRKEMSNPVLNTTQKHIFQELREHWHLDPTL